ncbi:diaminopimelate epimerase [Caproiciproducens sp. NJN-50]|uniref:diaminopimelate epimerase n=1 Tax=Acutalibacteraceae TaxID=3082771 RepID=UPI000FFE0DC3|nr:MULTISPECIES: diaminopimelate epimerase [Acutalibacteraceae]QAT49713.1 diaminopimelate epimerase [Caproiciproducens sp. NJN-50]
MKFTKMQGIGNDYIYVDCFHEAVEHPSELAVKLSDRHFGIGSDGIILIEPSELADCKMDMYNADGSRGKMCGNGIRCVGKYVYERGIIQKEILKVETLSGVKTLRLDVRNGRVASVEVNMGTPIRKASEIPVVFSKEAVLNEPLSVGGREYRITCVSMGNPHCVVFVEDVNALKLEEIGPLFEHHPIFPDRVNTEFVQILGKDELKMRVWERGSGETLACGTGACAAACAAAWNRKTGRQVKIHLRGGDLSIRWGEETDEIFLKGPAEFVFDGVVKI